MLHIKMKISAGAGRQSNPVLYLFFIVCRWTALRDGLFLSSLVFCPKFLIERFHTGSLKAQIFRVTNLKPNYGVPPFMCVYRGSWRSRQTFEVSVTAELHSTTSSSLKIIIIIIIKKTPPKLNLCFLREDAVAVWHHLLLIQPTSDAHMCVCVNITFSCFRDLFLI